MSTVLLLSGGVDSSCIAAITRPDLSLMVNYGQRPAYAESVASAAIARHLDIPYASVEIDLSMFGNGLLVSDEPVADAPTPEWFPYRNQFLATVAAAYAVTRGFDEVVLGTVAGDGDRHVDGTAEFYEALDGLVRMQEGGTRIRAPFVDTETAELIRRSGLPEGIVRWTHSCHTGDLACGQCPGCHRRRHVLAEVYGQPVG